ncbi:MAG: hypothetical protein K6G03_02835, partial [Lachnospiraceae bacterium]|nr:hypothetical protein [Lachnospiraceae bacterium]
MKKKTSKKIIVAILLVTMLSQTLYSAAASIFGVRAQSYAYADDEITEDVEPGEMVDETTQADSNGPAAEENNENAEAAEATESSEGTGEEGSEGTAATEEAAVATEEGITAGETSEGEVREVPNISLRISYKDQDGSDIKDSEDYIIDPAYIYIFKYEAPDIENHTYSNTTVYIEDNDTEVTAISSEDVDGIQVYSVTTDDDIDDKAYEDIAWTELKEDSELVMHYEKAAEESKEEKTEEVSENKTAEEETVSENETEKEEKATKRVYEYEDSRVYAKATLEKADAIPDDAVFVVKDVTGSSDADDAVDKADKATDTNLDKEKARVYDIHFENEELGEIEPEEGSVKIEIRFKKSIIAPEGEEEAGDRAVILVHVSDDGEASEVEADIADGG